MDWLVSKRASGLAFTGVVVIFTSVRMFRSVAYSLRGVAADLAQRASDCLGNGKALRESERCYGAVFEKAPFAMTLTRLPDRTIVSVNDAFLHLYECTRDQVLGHSAAEVGQPPLPGELETPGQGQSFTEERTTGSGTVRTLFLTVDPVRISGRDYVLTTSEDVTERLAAEEEVLTLAGVLESRVAERTAELEAANRSLRESREQARRQLAEIETIYRSARVGLCVLDRELRYRRVNDLMAAINGVPAADHVCRTVREVIPGLADAVEGLAATVFSTGQPLVDVEIHGRVSPDGPVRFWREQWMPLVDETGAVAGINVAAEEITDRRRAEEKLKELNRALQARADQLSALTLELTRTEDRERRRLAGVIHDHVQQLLVGARFALEGLAGPAGAGPAVKERLGQVQEALDECVSAVRSLTAELAPPILYRAGLNHGLAWLVRWMGEKHGLAIELSAEEKPDALCPDLRVLAFQAVRELLFNVVKHAGVRRAALRSWQRPDGTLELVVADEGCGFDRAALEARLAVGGCFGLFSVRERLAAVGASLEIDGAPGRGSRMTLVFPAAGRAAATPAGGPPAAADKAEAAARPAAPGRKLTVLLADDHRILREGISRLIGDQPDMEVVGEAEDGIGAVELALQLRPDVVIMDVSMPRMNGIAATRRIKVEHPCCRVIALTMHAREEMEQRMRAAGADAYLDKVRASELLVAAIRGAAVAPSVAAEPPVSRPLA
jgi:PAS domain S-box-containing protein